MDKYGKYLYESDIESLCRQFLDNEENTRIFNSIDRQELGNTIAYISMVN